MAKVGPKSNARRKAGIGLDCDKVYERVRIGIVDGKICGIVMIRAKAPFGECSACLALLGELIKRTYHEVNISFDEG